eukprot:743110_1
MEPRKQINEQTPRSAAISLENKLQALFGPVGTGINIDQFGDEKMKKKSKTNKKIRKHNPKKHTNINKNEMLGLINIDTITDFGAAIQQRRKSRYDFGEQKIQKKKIIIANKKTQLKLNYL